MLKPAEKLEFTADKEEMKTARSNQYKRNKEGGAISPEPVRKFDKENMQPAAVVTDSVKQ